MSHPIKKQILQKTATKLGLAIESNFDGGSFGACRVRDSAGNAQVLKAVPSEAFEKAWSRGALMCEQMRNIGYPCPQYFGTGVVDGVCWSLQSVMPGKVPEKAQWPVATLVKLVQQHTDRAPTPGDTTALVIQHVERDLEQLRQHTMGTGIAREFGRVLKRHRPDFRHTDVVHGDYHPLNCLVQGSELSGVFDWEGARPGDWRFDLANLAVVCPGTEADTALDAYATRDVIAFCVVWHSARYLAFESKVRPKGLEARIEVNYEELSHWWRAS